MSALRRRRLLQAAGVAGLGLLAGCGRLPGQVQPSRPAPRVAVLGGSAATAASFDAFRAGLHELGYTDGQNIIVEFHDVMRGGEALLDDVVADIVRRGPEVVVAPSELQTQAARRATDSIPIVMAASNDPVGSGLVMSLARPGGNITGLSQYSTRLIGKRLELLTKAVPTISRVLALGLLSRPSEIQEVQAAADALGIVLQLSAVRVDEDVITAVESAVQDGAEALVTLASPILVRLMPQLAQLATARQLPAIADREQFAHAGGLMTRLHLVWADVGGARVAGAAG